jgi:hypothetical protein
MRREKEEREVFIPRPSKPFHMGRLYCGFEGTWTMVLQILTGVRSTPLSVDRMRHSVAISLFFVSRSRTNIKITVEFSGRPSRAQNINRISSCFGSPERQSVVLGKKEEGSRAVYIPISPPDTCT